MSATRWSNWSGKQKSDGQVQVLAPVSESELSSVLADPNHSGQRIRAVGASHSHSRIAAPDELMVVTDNWQGVTGLVKPLGLPQPDLSGPARMKPSDVDDVASSRSTSDDLDQSSPIVRVKSGTRIFQMGEPLWHLGFGLMNQGDIDRQSIAGAMSTGTHGSGSTLKNISASVVGARILLADGELAECSRWIEPELFELARHSLGSVGLVVDVDLAVRRRYKLEERLWSEDPNVVMADIENLITSNRHFEFFWMPDRDKCACKSLNELSSNDDSATSVEPIEQHSKLHRSGWSHQIISTLRHDLHTEMEFAVPASSGPACFLELRVMILKRFPDLQWPLEYRTVAEDDLAISTATGRPTVTISVHQDVSIDDQPLFDACEEIFRRHDGRPHWGKVHYHTGADLARLYPRYGRWWQDRDRFDPDGRFLNSYVEDLRP